MCFIMMHHSATICYSHGSTGERQRGGFPVEICMCLQPKSSNVLGGCSLVSLSGICCISVTLPFCKL